ncbi:hypothetical protein Ddye_003538 [Dipteronia dyeriana]|uniref:Uncharacterized protein n=1 Tax=Dipteronia dyeriana TaxID=168575 RepID=A0AAD9XSH2_9ROSI|nr:hypothetical protein Ddye_003538 [Dipteronia dyeriana]
MTGVEEENKLLRIAIGYRRRGDRLRQCRRDPGHLVDGLPENEHFEQWNAELAVDLKMNGDQTWNDHRHPLLNNQLKLDAGFWSDHSSKGPLPFLYLITHFCEAAGINVHGGGWTMFPHLTDMGKRVYNDLAKHREARLLRDQLDEVESDDDLDDPNYNVEGDIDAVKADHGPVMDQMLCAIDDMSLRMDDNHHTYMEQFTYIYDRMNAF